MTNTCAAPAFLIRQESLHSEAAQRLIADLNAELTALAQQARFEPDKAKYDEESLKLNAIHFATMPQIALWQPSQDAVMAKSIEGYTYQFLRQVDYRDLSRK